jgi:hypothetical protein
MRAQAKHDQGDAHLGVALQRIRSPTELGHEVDGRVDDPALCDDGAGVGAEIPASCKPRVGGSEEPRHASRRPWI